MRRRRIAALTATAAVCVSGAFAANAGAAFHEVKISEVHNNALVTEDFVELQMYSAGQNALTGHYIYVYNGTGGLVGDSPVPNPANTIIGESQRTFTIGNNATRDYNYGGVAIDGAAGAICWNENAAGLGGVDCVAWGTFTTGGGGAAMTSPPGVNAPAIPNGSSLQRKLTPGCATLLEAADDTNNGTDFTVGAPTPRNNSVAPTEKPCTPTKKSKCKKKKKKKGKVKAGSSAKKKKKCKKKKKKK
jgi:hypothetical protein